MVPAAVAAGHPATCAAGVEILAEGGSAADAAVAACLASCVAETVMTGLLGGGFAVYLDAASGRVRNLDFFVTVPSGEGGAMDELAVPFGEELVHYAIGAASCAVPGVPAGLEELWRAHGRLPWPRLCEPALRLAREGVPMPPAHASCLAMLAPVMTLAEGAGIYAPGGRLLEAGELLRQPGLAAALELLAQEGAAAAYTGEIAARPARAAGGARRHRHRRRPRRLPRPLVGAGRGPARRLPLPHPRRPLGGPGDAGAAAAAGGARRARSGCPPCSRRLRAAARTGTRRTSASSTPRAAPAS